MQNIKEFFKILYVKVCLYILIVKGKIVVFFKKFKPIQSFKDIVGKHKFNTPSFPKNFVEQVFIQNPSTEDLLRGSEIKNGMIVLIHDVVFQNFRNFEDPENREPYSYHRLLTEARWCVVTDLEVHRPDGLVSFIGLYADGTKHVRTYSNQWCWYVKRNSM